MPALPSSKKTKSSASASTSASSSSTLSKLFDKYRDSPTTAPDTITINGILSYFSDLSLPMDSIGVLILSEIVASPTLGEIHRQGFLTGWSTHGGSPANTISGQKILIHKLMAQLSSPEAQGAGGSGLFRRVYKHTFKVAVPAGTRGIPLDQASEYWRLLFGPTGAQWGPGSASGGLTKPWLEWYLTYLETKWKKAVNKDMWDQTLAFEEKTREDEGLGWWEEGGAWPTVIDDFVEWCKVEKGLGKGDKMEE